jgi:hypothetical protein
VPITDVLNELERQTGASVRGSLLDPREVTAEFRDVPLSQALARLLGDQNFALVYGEGGRLRTLKTPARRSGYAGTSSVGLAADDGSAGRESHHARGVCSS